MKRIILAIVVSATVLGGAFFATQNVALASSGNSDMESKTIPKSKTVNKTWFGTSRNIDIKGTVHGDVFCAAQTVTITGTIDGDLLCAAQTLNIQDGAVINGDVRATAQTLDVSDKAYIKQNMTVFAQILSIGKQASIGGDLNGFSQQVTLRGDVARDFSVDSQQVKISGDIGRNVDIEVQTLKLDEDASIGGSLHYSSAKKADIPKGVVTEKTTWSQVENEHNDSTSARVMAYVTGAITLLVLAVVFSLLWPRFIHDSTDINSAQFGLSIVIGFFAIFVTPIVATILAVSFFGWPIALGLGLVWVLLFIPALPMSMYLLGRFMLQDKQHNVVLTMLIGSVAFLILCLIPVVNAIIVFLAITTGYGMILRRFGGFYHKPDYAIAGVTKAKKQKQTTKKK